MTRLIALAVALICLWAGACGAAVMSTEDLIQMTDSFLGTKNFSGLVEFAESLHDYEALLVIARRAYEKLPESEPQFRGFALRGIAEAYEGLKQYERAIPTYRQIIQEYPDSPQVPWSHLGIARSLIGLGRHDEARSELSQMLVKWPNTTAAAWAEEQIGYSYLAQENPREALPYIKRALYNYPPEKYPRVIGLPSLRWMRIEIAVPHLHEAYVQLADDAAALEEFTKLRQAEDVGPTALYYTAVHHQGLGHYDQAIELFTRYIQMPDQFFRQPDARFNRGMCYFAKGDYDRAIADWREVAENYPLHYLAEEAPTWIKAAEERKSGG